MTTFVHKATLKLMLSAALSDLTEPIENYLTNPDLSAVYDELNRIELVPRKYWKLSGGIVIEMTQAEKDALDAAAAQAALDAEVSELDSGSLRRFVLVVLDEFNRVRAKTGDPQITVDQFKTAMRGK